MRLAAALNLAKAWLLALGSRRVVRRRRLGARRLPQAASLFVFCALLAALAVYAYADRALLGMLGAREYALAEDPILRSTVDALSAKLGIVPPKLYLIPDGFPRALAAGRGPERLGARGLDGSARSVEPGASSRGCSRTSSRTCAAATCSSRPRR